MLEYDPIKAKYVEDGKVISDDNVKRLVLLFIYFLSDELESIAQKMLDGELTIGEWQKRTWKLVKDGNVAIGILGYGGAVQFAEPKRAMVSGDLRFLGDRLNEMARRIEELDWPRLRSIPAILNRVRSYASYLNVVFEQSNRYAHADHFNEERNVLGNAEHCTGAGSCVEQTDRGWQPIGTLLPIGARKCRVNCKCRFIYR